MLDGGSGAASRAAYSMTSPVFAVESYAGSFRRVKVILPGNSTMPNNILRLVARLRVLVRRPLP